MEMDGENPNGRLDWGLVSERVGLRLKQEYGAENWNCLAVLPSGLRHWGMPYLILRVDDAAVDRRLSFTHLLIAQPRRFPLLMLPLPWRAPCSSSSCRGWPHKVQWRGVRCLFTVHGGKD